MPYIAVHQNLVSTAAETESLIRRLHSQDKAAPLPQKGMGTAHCSHSQTNKRRWTSDANSCNTWDQDNPNVQVELESRGSSMIFCLKTAWHLVSLISRSSTHNYNWRCNNLSAFHSTPVLFLLSSPTSKRPSIQQRTEKLNLQLSLRLVAPRALPTLNRNPRLCSLKHGCLKECC